MIKYREFDENFAEIWRVFISGSSEAGKTYFARQLLEKKFFKYNRIYYYHPDIQETFPVDWTEHFSIPIFFQAGIPSEKELLEIPHYSCIVLDDLFTQACGSRQIDYLFRVLSSKRKLSVIIMTQRYFAEGDIGRNIRNSSNYHVLMTNADERTNMRVASVMDLKLDFKKAIELNKNKLYPYIFIDKTKYARLSGIKIYIDIFSRAKQVIYNSMLSYLISEADFKAHFSIIDNNVAVKNGGNEKSGKTRPKPNSKSKEYEKETTSSGTGEKRRSNPGYAKYLKRKEFERKVGSIIQRYQVRSKL